MISLLLASALSLSTHAATLIECTELGSTEVIFRLRYEGAAPRGPASLEPDGWQMQHLTEFAPTKVTGRTPYVATEKPDGSVELLNTYARDHAGPVGKRLVLSGLEDNVTLSIQSFGGFVGKLRLDGHPCVVTKDYCGSLLAE